MGEGCSPCPEDARRCARELRDDRDRKARRSGACSSASAGCAQCAQREADRRTRRRPSGVRGGRRNRLRRADRLRKGFRRRRRHQGNARKGLRRRVFGRFSGALGRGGACSQADRRGGQRLRAWRRLRTGDDVRFHSGVGQCAIRSARDQAWRHSRRRRHAASDPRHRQGQGDGACASPAASWAPRKPSGRDWCRASCRPPICCPRRSRPRKPSRACRGRPCSQPRTRSIAPSRRRWRKAWRFERRAFYALFATKDQKEGMSAFIEKRRPKFQNR